MIYKLYIHILLKLIIKLLENFEAKAASNEANGAQR